MFKWIKALGVAAILTMPWALPVSATDMGGPAHEIAVNTTDQLLNATGETSSVLSATPFQNLTIFVSGTYGNANVVWVQKEKGSPGSGAWENFFRLNLNTANARQIEGVTNGPTPGRYRLAMTNFDSGAVVAYMTNYPRAARAWDFPTSTMYGHFDDLQWTEDDNANVTVINVEKWLATEEGGGNGTQFIYDISNQEGAVVGISGTADLEEECFSELLPANSASLVSNGWLMFETRIALNVLTTRSQIGFNDVICTADTTPAIFAGGVLTGLSNIAVITLDDEATSTGVWQAASAIGAVEGANAGEVEGSTAVVTNYVVLRVEVDNLGNAYFFHAGLLFHVEPLAVATNVELSPYVLTSATAVATAAVTMTVDYWWFIHARPTAPTT